MTLRRFLTSAALVLALMPASAHAQSDGDKAAARSLTREGYAALDKKDYPKALDRFTRADALYHGPTVLLGLARAQAALGKLVAAQETYNRLLHEPVPAGATPMVKAAFDDARKELAALEKRLPTITVLLAGATSANVTFDGAAMSPAVLGVKRPVDPGTHAARAEAAGFAPAEASVTIAEGEDKTVTVELRPVAAASTAVGPATPAAAAPTGMHVRRKIGIGVGAVGVASLGAGIALGAVALGKRSDLTKLCSDAKACPASAQGTIDSYHTLGNASFATILIGGAAMVTGTVLFFTAPRTPPAETAVVPQVGLGYVGLKGGF